MYTSRLLYGTYYLFLEKPPSTISSDLLSLSTLTSLTSLLAAHRLLAPNHYQYIPLFFYFFFSSAPSIFLPLLFPLDITFLPPSPKWCSFNFVLKEQRGLWRPYSILLFLEKDSMTTNHHHLFLKYTPAPSKLLSMESCSFPSSSLSSYLAMLKLHLY